MADEIKRTFEKPSEGEIRCSHPCFKLGNGPLRFKIEGDNNLCKAEDGKDLDCVLVKRWLGAELRIIT